MIIKKNVTLCFLSINGQDIQIMIVKKDGYYCAYWPDGGLLFKYKRMKDLVLTLEQYEQLNDLI